MQIGIKALPKSVKCCIRYIIGLGSAAAAAQRKSVSRHMSFFVNGIRRGLFVVTVHKMDIKCHEQTST